MPSFIQTQVLLAMFHTGSDFENKLTVTKVIIPAHDTPSWYEEQPCKDSLQSEHWQLNYGKMIFFILTILFSNSC